MAQYIDKSALVAEIKIQIHNIDYEGLSDRNIGQEQSLYHILSFLDTLEVKEVDSTDAFIEKACEKLKKYMYDNLMFQGRLYCEEVIDNFVEGFKTYMKVE